MFPLTWKVAFAGIRSLHVERQSNPVLGELRSTPHVGDQSVPEPGKVAATDQRTARDLDSLLDRYGIVS